MHCEKILSCLNILNVNCREITCFSTALEVHCKKSNFTTPLKSFWKTITVKNHLYNLLLCTLWKSNKYYKIFFDAQCKILY
jgi:hypothetical protein